MRYGSVCSGIEAATVAWHPLGWQPSFFSEIEAFPRAVLQHHYPSVPLHGDFTTIRGNEYAAIDLLVGGTPCQSFSIAGLRGGLADGRGNLSLEFLRLADRTRPRWLVWENVPGVLSSNGGRDFGAILGGMVELGYGFAYRVLDAQFFGVPQRRRRVFVIGHLGDWRPACAVLFERHSLSGHPAPRRQAGQSAACGFEIGPSGGGFTDLSPTLDTRCKDGPIRNQLGAGVITASTGDVAHCLNAGGMRRQDYESETLIAHTLEASAGRSRGAGTPIGLLTHAIQAGALRQNPNSGPDGVGVQEGIAYTLEARAEVQAVAFAAATVRRLTPRECERLQGFPDDYTLIPFGSRKKLEASELLRLRMTRPDLTMEEARRLAADGPRYKALGNSMAVPVMRWIGERIAAVDAFTQENRRAA